MKGTRNKGMTGRAKAKIGRGHDREKRGRGAGRVEQEEGMTRR